MFAKEHIETILTNDIEFHILEMPKTKITQVEDDKLALWLEFLKNPYSKEVMKNMKKEENKYLKQAEKELQYLKGKPEFKRLVEAREGFLRDQHAFETAGQKQEQIKIAKKLLHMNMPVEQIMEITELSKEEIEKLK